MKRILSVLLVVMLLASQMCVFAEASHTSLVDEVKADESVDMSLIDEDGIIYAEITSYINLDKGIKPTSFYLYMPSLDGKDYYTAGFDKNEYVATTKNFVATEPLKYYTVSAYDGKQVIVVRNTEKHGLYITVGGTKIYCDKTELPFIDENNRTQVPVRAISNAFGKKVIWHESAKVVTISTYGDKEGGTIEFAIGSDEMTKNGEKIKMDTKTQIVDGHTYVPLRYLGEALNCDVEYTEADRFADIIVTRTSDFAGFNQTDSITVWGNIESAFHEGGGLGSIRPFEGEEPDLNGTMIRKYNVVFMSQEKSNEKYMEVDVYWDTLYNKTYAKIDNVLYSANESFPRFLDSLLESGEDAIYVIDETDRIFLLKHGWNINYKISSITETLPQFGELGEFSAKDFYYLYNNELSKDAGLDMSLYAGKDVTVEIYHLRERMPEKFGPIDTARGIIVKFKNQIIGAYISSGRHQVEIACSLSGKDFKEITQKTVDEYIAELLKEEASLQRFRKNMLVIAC